MTTPATLNEAHDIALEETSCYTVIGSFLQRIPPASAGNRRQTMYVKSVFSGSVKGAAATLAVLLALGASGCVASSRSSASSASLASAAISLQSSSDMMFAARQDYREDVQVLALAAVESGASGGELLDQVGRIAFHHGITDWEADELTYRALGEGLALAGVDRERAHVFAEEVAGGDTRAVRAVFEGFES